MHRSNLGLRSAVMIVATLSGCADVGFEIGEPLPESRVMGNPLGGLLGGLFEVPIPLDVDVASETAARDTGPAMAVRLVDLRLAITSTDEPPGDTDDFAFVERLDIFVESAQEDSSLPEVAIGQATRPASGARQLGFTVDPSVNLLPYLNEGARITSSGSVDLPPDDVSFDGDATLRVEVF